MQSLIEPVVLYGSERWGAFMYRKVSSLENIFSNFKLPFRRLQTKICKKILGVRKNSSNLPVLAELGIVQVPVHKASDEMS